MQIRGSFAKGSLIALAITLIPTTAVSAQTITPGSSCKTLNQKVIYQNRTYTCIKSGKNFVWNKGVSLKKPTLTPTPTQIFYKPGSQTPVLKVEDSEGCAVAFDSTGKEITVPTLWAEVAGKWLQVKTEEIGWQKTCNDSRLPNNKYFAFAKAAIDNGTKIRWKFVGPVNIEERDAQGNGYSKPIIFTTPRKLVIPSLAKNNSGLTWQNIESRVSEIGAAAWQSTQDALKENGKGNLTISIKVIYAPKTANSHYVGFDDYLRTGIQLWNRFYLPPNSTFLVYSYDEIPWAQSTITKILADSGMSQSQARQAGTNLASAPYGNPDCGGANAGMLSDTQAIGVFGLCPRNEGTDPYYEGPLQIHEFTHQIQDSQFVGTKFNKQQILPCWISEGLAHAGGLSAGTKTLNAYLAVRKSQAAHPVLGVAGGGSGGQLDTSSIDYNFMKKFYSESAPPSCFGLPSYALGYSIGFLTTEALAAIGGIESPLLLYTRTASGETFEEAFKNIYGIDWLAAQNILAKVVVKEFIEFR